MRHVFLYVSDEQRETIRSLLNGRGFDFIVIDDNTDRALFLFPLPSEAVSSLLDELYERGIDEDGYTILTKAEFVATENYEEIRQQYTSAIGGLSQAEFHAQVREIQWPHRTYYLGTILSVIAAAAGLLLDSPALVIGSMVIAPQVSSALSASIGALLADWDMFVDSAWRQFVGLSLAIFCAGAFGWIVRWTGIVPASVAVTQIELIGLRFSPTFLSTIGALAAGTVGAFGFTTEQSMALVGVMIAAALVPAAAAVGIGIAWAAPGFAIGALLLLLVNVLAINIGAFITLLLMEYRPHWVKHGQTFRQTIPPKQQTVVYGIIVFILIISLGSTYLTTSQIAFQQNVNEEVDETLTEPPYQSITVKTVQSEYQGTKISEPTIVTVRAIKSSSQSYPLLATLLENRIEQRTEQDVHVQILFTESVAANKQAVKAQQQRPIHILQRSTGNNACKNSLKDYKATQRLIDRHGAIRYRRSHGGDGPVY